MLRHGAHQGFGGGALELLAINALDDDFLRPFRQADAVAFGRIDQTSVFTFSPIELAELRHFSQAINQFFC